MIEIATGAFPPPPSTRELVKRSVFVIHITPLSGKLTPLARKLHIVLCRLAGSQFRLFDESEREAIEARLRSFVEDFRQGKQKIKPPLLLQPRFSASLRELAEMVGHDPREARHLLPHLKLLQACHVEYNSLHQAASEEEHLLYPDELVVIGTLLSSIVLSRRGEVSWAFDPVVLSLMVMPRTYTHLNLELVRNASTYAAVALYENCRRFVGVNQTGVYPMARWRKLLSTTGQIPKWRDNEKELMRTVKLAVRELRECPGCDITLEPIKVRLPNNQWGLQFKVQLLEVARPAFDGPVVQDKETHQLLTGLGFPAATSSHILESHGADYVEEKLALLAKHKTVKDPKAWFIAALTKDFQDREARADEATEAKERSVESLRTAEFVKEAFEAWRALRVRLKFYRTDESEQAGWERRFADAKPNLRLTGKAKESAFMGWLGQQKSVFLTEPSETDPFVFASVRPDLVAAACTSKQSD